MRLVGLAVCCSLLLVIFGCALPKPEEKTIAGRQYIDPNIPAINIQFPFDIWLRSEDTVSDNSGDASMVQKVTTLTTSKANTIVYINKIYLPQSNAYFTGVNYEKEKLYYKDKKRNNSGCFVYYKEYSGKHYLVGDIIKYGNGNVATNVRISEYFYDIYGHDDLSTKHRESVDEMIDDIKDICGELLEH